MIPVSSMEKTVIAIPTYNERECLGETIAELRRELPHVHCVIVDDASPDGTGELAEEMAAKDGHIHVLHRSGKEGLGPAYLHAFSWARTAGFSWVGEMDADGSHRPRQLKRLVWRAQACEDAPDVVIGSRWVRGGAVNGWAKRREMLSRAGNAYIGLWLNLGVADATAGFRLYRLDLFDRLDLGLIDCAGYAFQIDMTRQAVRAGARIAEVPITFDERRAGESKMSANIIGEALKQVTIWGVKDTMELIMSKLG